MREIVIIAHDMRSTHNVGSLLRTAEGLGVAEVFLTGYTPYPAFEGDDRLPFISTKLTKQINKTALGTETMVPWQHQEDIISLISQLKADHFTIAVLEQSPNSTKLTDYTPPDKIALILGREVEGVDKQIIKLADLILEIPMLGKKESFNVVQAAAMALYQLRFA